MNERYLFRGKRLDNETWVRGFYALDNDIPTIIMPKGSYWRVISSTVGQCTGLRDKNGTLIFEGDIVKYIVPSPFEDDEEKWDKCVVSYEFGWYEPFQFISACDSQVVGTIHTTPELMEGNDDEQTD